MTKNRIDVARSTRDVPSGAKLFWLSDVPDDWGDLAARRFNPLEGKYVQAVIPFAGSLTTQRVAFGEAESASIVGALDKALHSSITIATVEAGLRLINRRYRELQDRILTLESRLQRVENEVGASSSQLHPLAAVFGDAILSAAKQAEEELGWDVNVQFFDEANCLNVIVPEARVDSIADQMWDFTRRLAQLLPPGVFRELKVEMLVLDEDEGTGAT
jgi:hypothetical protein